jgi:hypothetical protein
MQTQFETAEVANWIRAISKCHFSKLSIASLAIPRHLRTEAPLCNPAVLTFSSPPAISSDATKAKLLQKSMKFRKICKNLQKPFPPYRSSGGFNHQVKMVRPFFPGIVFFWENKKMPTKIKPSGQKLAKE